VDSTLEAEEGDGQIVMEHEERSVGVNGRGVNEPPLRGWDELADLLAGIVPESSVADALTGLARDAVEGGGATRAAFFVRRPRRPNLALEGAHGFDDADDRSRLLDFGRRMAAWVEKTGAALDVGDPEEDPRFPDVPEGCGPCAAFPLSGHAGSAGALVAFGVDSVGEPRLAVLARLGALLLDRDHAAAHSRELSRNLDESEKRLIVIERLAAAGESLLETNREFKAPLAGMGGLAARVAETLDPDDPRRSMLEMIVEESARLDRILQDQIEATRSPSPVLVPEDVNRLVTETLALAAADLAREKVRVTRRLGSSLPALLVDADLMRRMLLNLVRVGLEGTGSGGRVKVETKRRGDVVEILIAADGKREPGAALEYLWRPFRADGPGDEVTGAGVERILRDHRGMLRVFSTHDWPLVFSLVLPIAGNQDRRRGSRDRRRAA
jgi:signal transduction histidine kinase